MGLSVLALFPSFLLDWNKTCTRPVREGGQIGRSSIHICKFAFRAGRHRFFWLGDRLLHLGWSGLVWFSEEQSRRQPDAGLMGFLDAGVHAVPHRHLSADRTNMVQRLRQSGSSVHGRPRLYRLRHSLVRDVVPAIYRFQRAAGWLDGHSIPVSQRSWR